MNKKLDNILFIIGLTVVGVFLTFIVNATALTSSKAKNYVNKRVIVSFINDDRHLIAIKGKVIIYVKPSNDYTIDDYYSYLVIETIDSLEVVKIREIQLIKELR